jgi:two-component system, NarL family, nitrate/nitrite response regulator NarL
LLASANSAPVLVVDNDAILRNDVAAVFRRAGYRVSTSGDGEEALRLARIATPLLVVLEICLPGICGYELCFSLREEFGAALPIMFVSQLRAAPCDRVASLLLGGDDFLAKPFELEELRLRAQRLIRRPFARAAGLHPLTAREDEVLGLLASGNTQTEIAKTLSISERTVAHHIEHILAKLGVHNRVQAVAAALRPELLTNGSGQTHTSISRR